MSDLLRGYYSLHMRFSDYYAYVEFKKLFSPSIYENYLILRTDILLRYLFTIANK